MLSMRACQDFANAHFFLFILYINNFPFKYNVRVFSNGHIEVFSGDVQSSHRYIFVIFFGGVKKNIAKFVWGSIFNLPKLWGGFFF